MMWWRMMTMMTLLDHHRVMHVHWRTFRYQAFKITWNKNEKIITWHLSRNYGTPPLIRTVRVAAKMFKFCFRVNLAFREICPTFKVILFKFLVSRNFKKTSFRSHSPTRKEYKDFFIVCSFRQWNCVKQILEAVLYTWDHHCLARVGRLVVDDGRRLLWRRLVLLLLLLWIPGIILKPVNILYSFSCWILIVLSQNSHKSCEKKNEEKNVKKLWNTVRKM